MADNLGARARLGLQADPAAVHLDQRLDQRQAEPGAALTALAGAGFEFADVLARIAEHPAQRLDELLPLELEENVGGQELGSVTLDPFQRKSH